MEYKDSTEEELEVTEQMAELLNQVLIELQAVKTEVLNKVEDDERFEGIIDRLDGLEDRLDAIFDIFDSQENVG